MLEIEPQQRCRPLNSLQLKPKVVGLYFAESLWLRGRERERPCECKVGVHIYLADEEVDGNTALLGESGSGVGLVLLVESERCRGEARMRRECKSKVSLLLLLLRVGVQWLRYFFPCLFAELEDEEDGLTCTK